METESKDIPSQISELKVKAYDLIQKRGALVVAAKQIEAQIIEIGDLISQSEAGNVESPK